MHPIPLSDRTLRYHARNLPVPCYDRAALTPAVVHLSVGYFHRSHQAVYFDELARRGHTAWGLTGVGLRRRNMCDALGPQNGLYTVVERDLYGDGPSVVGVMGRYLFAPDDRRRVVAALADERTRLVTLTVTGAGYDVDPATGAFDADDDEVTMDVVDPAKTHSALALLVEALDLRRRARRAPFTVLSCDNIPANGEVTHDAVVSFAHRRDEGLGRWIETNVSFPSSMADRITPTTTDADRERLASAFGVVDAWPVMTEPFTDWVIEDDFCNDRPPLEDVGVRFVSDAQPYALTKTRLLNASHLLLGTLGRIAGVATMAELMSDRTYRAFAESVMEAEIEPGLPASAVDLDVYRRALIERMSNPTLQDRLSRLCRGASLKFARHVLPSIEAAREARRPYPLLTLGAAGLCRHFRAADRLNRRFELDDPAASLLTPRAVAAGSDPRLLLSETSIFGALGQDAEFVRDVERVLEAFDRDGVRPTVARALASDALLAA